MASDVWVNLWAEVEVAVCRDGKTQYTSLEFDMVKLMTGLTPEQAVDTVTAMAKTYRNFQVIDTFNLKLEMNELRSAIDCVINPPDEEVA